MRGHAEESGGRETRPFALIDAALKEAEISREEIECIVVGLGPGSYAGIRIAIAIAQGWQVARSVKLLGISSAEAVAAHAVQLGEKNPVFVGLEAQREGLYVERYDASAFESPKLIDPFHAIGEEESRGLRVVRMDRLPRDKSEDGFLCLPPNADFLVTLAMHRSDFVPGHALEPVYLRKVEFVKAPPARIRIP